MIRDALGGERLIGMIQPRDPQGHTRASADSTRRSTRSAAPAGSRSSARPMTGGS